MPAAATAWLVEHTRTHGGRVVAVGTTVVRALESALGRAKEAGEIRALLWAAAQLDTQDGYDLVRTARDEHPDRQVRQFAERTLRNPRRSLVLPKR